MKYLLLLSLLLIGCEINIGECPTEEKIFDKIEIAYDTGECVPLKVIKPKRLAGNYCIKYINKGEQNAE